MPRSSELIDAIDAQHDRVIRQNEEIDIFRRDVPEYIAEMILEEAQELVCEFKEAMVTGCAWKLAGEMGDIIYLLIRLSDLTVISLSDALELKIARNKEKYGGQTDQAVAKREWKTKGGDEEFSHRYLQGDATSQRGLA